MSNSVAMKRVTPGITHLPGRKAASETMEDLEAALAKLLADAEDCDLIGNLANDLSKRATFRRLAAHHRQMAEELKSAIARSRPNSTAHGALTHT